VKEAQPELLSAAHKIMNEKDFSQKIASYLELGNTQMKGETAARLAQARERALTAYRAPVSILGLVTVSGKLLDPAYVVRKPLFWLPILAAALAIWLVQPNAADNLYDDSGVIDAKLLTGELPIDAFLDKDFATWVQEKESAAQ